MWNEGRIGLKVGRLYINAKKKERVFDAGVRADKGIVALIA